MDYKNFHDGLLSLSLVLFIFSLTLIIGSVILKPYIALEPSEQGLIVIIALINLIFSIYYLIEALNLNKIFKLNERYIKIFAKRTGVITLIYSPHIFILSAFLFIDLHNLQIMIIFLIIFIELLLIGLVFKEVYDLMFREEAEREFELKKNQKLYFDK